MKVSGSSRRARNQRRACQQQISVDPMVRLTEWAIPNVAVRRMMAQKLHAMNRRARLLGMLEDVCGIMTVCMFVWCLLMLCLPVHSIVLHFSAMLLVLSYALTIPCKMMSAEIYEWQQRSVERFGWSQLPRQIRFRAEFVRRKFRTANILVHTLGIDPFISVTVDDREYFFGQWE